MKTTKRKTEASGQPGKIGLTAKAAGLRAGTVSLKTTPDKDWKRP